MQIKDTQSRSRLQKTIKELDKEKKKFFIYQQEAKIITLLLPINRVSDRTFWETSRESLKYGYFPSARLRKVINFQKLEKNIDISLFINKIKGKLISKIGPLSLTGINNGNSEDINWFMRYSLPPKIAEFSFNSLSPVVTAQKYIESIELVAQRTILLKLLQQYFLLYEI